DFDLDICRSEEIDPLADPVDRAVESIADPGEEIDDPFSHAGLGVFDVDDLLLAGLQAICGELGMLESYRMKPDCDAGCSGSIEPESRLPPILDDGVILYGRILIRSEDAIADSGPQTSRLGVLFLTGHWNLPHALLPKIAVPMRIMVEPSSMA